ncbi:MAG: hypothetical protein PHE55_07650 [Methylococcaceae bacterium]|nr:hypothetical protein [Methylococcaceae bacterium]
MGLAAAERRLQLNDRIATFARQALDHRVEQQTHALGDERTLEEQGRILVFARGRARMDARQIRRELGLLERTLEHVFVGNGDFTPRLECHDGRF